MKNIILIILGVVCFGFQGFSQETSFERRGHSTFLELGGTGFTYSLNYESRFGNSHRGLGARIGLGFSGTELSDISVPITVNYLLGKPEGKHFLELGVGYTYLDLRDLDSFEVNDEPVFFEGTSFGHFVIGYTRHPPLGGFLFKFGITPLVGDFSDGRVALGWLGLAFGYAF